MNRLLRNSGKIFIIVLLIAWITIVFVDYFRNLDGKDPIFCLKEVTNKYSDGEVYICTGFGYKVIRYERKNLDAKEFGPFFIKEKQPEIEQ